MSSLRDLAIDLINDAKGAKTAAALFNLEQVKEIMFHRDTSILSELAPDVINDFMVERSAAMRRFLVHFAALWMQHDFPTALPVSLSMYSFLLASDSSDGSLRQIALQLTLRYDRAVMHIVGLPVKTRTSTGADPKTYWNSLRNIVTRLTDMISSDRAERLRAESLRLAEKMVLFGLPAEQVSLDPRLARSRAAAAGGGDGNKAGAANIPLTHPFINRNDLEQEAEALFSKMLLWASKGGPQGHPFTPAQMSLLGTMVANVAASRLKKSGNAATALAVLLQGKGNMCAAMTGAERDQLARSIQVMLRAAYAQADPDNLMGKLRTALDALVALGTDTAPSSSSSSLLAKRDRDELEEPDDDDDPVTAGAVTAELGQTAAALRASAIAAVEAAANSIATKQPRAGAAPSAESILAAAVAAAPSSSSSASAVTADTELPSDLGDFAETPTLANVKLISLQPVTAASSSSLSSSGMVVKPTPPPSADTYVDMSLKAVQRVLESFQDVKNSSPKAAAAHLKLSARMIISMALTDLAEARQTPARVAVVASLSPAAVGPLLDDVAVEVTLPRVLWLVLSYCLSTVSGRGSAIVRSQKVEGLSAEKVELICSILKEIYGRIPPVDAVLARRKAEAEGDDDAAGDGGDDDPRNPLRALYASACAAVLSRALQAMPLRPVAKDIALALPTVPRNVLALLKLLVYTGTRAAAAPPPSGPASRRDTAPRNRGTRAEAIALLGQLVFASDADAGQQALRHLMWCAMADDFEIRGKAIAMLVGEVMPMADWAYETVTAFAVQAMVACVGGDVVGTRLQTLAAAAAAAPPVAEAAVVAASGEGDNDDAMAVDGEASGAAAAGGDEPPPAPSLTLEQAMETYDGGACYGGAFTSCPAFARAADPAHGGGASSSSRDKAEAHVKKALHLLTQICISEPPLLGNLFSLYGAAAAVAAEDAAARAADKAPAPEEAAPSTTAAATAAPADAAPSAPAAPAAPVGPSNKYELICALIERELESVVPVVARRMGTADMFALLATPAAQPLDPCARPLLERALEAMHADYNTPATSDVVARVRAYLASPAFVAAFATDGGTGADATAAAAASAAKDVAEVRLLMPVLGGFSSADVLPMLPRVLKTFADSAGGDGQQLLNAFRRIYAARPPALPKATLFAALHRLDIEAAGVKQKTVLDSISLCLGHKEDFRPEVLREALTDLLTDDVPAQALMRTAILAAQSYGNEMKKFMLSDVVPKVIRKKVWSTAPKVWDGVPHAVKILGEHKSAEPTLRCLLGLPKAQLKAVLKAAPKVKPPLGKLLAALSAEEKDECVSGRWAGIHEGDGAVDAEKAKIIKDLSAAS